MGVWAASEAPGGGLRPTSAFLLTIALKHVAMFDAQQQRYAFKVVFIRP